MRHYGEVTDVAIGSPAQTAGMRAGDRLVSLNGQPVRDIIDYRFHSAEHEVEVVFLRGNEMRQAIVEKEIDEPLGLDFAEELFDGVRTCDNCCVFCFVHQLPRGMRKSLYIRDDDYRLSFLHGNFITLASETEEDIRRIINQRLSPLYVSVHTSEERLRRAILRNPRAPEIMPRLTALTSGGIELHTQIVLCPGINDGDQLDRTIGDLAELYPGVRSIAVVPVGLTRHRRAPAKSESDIPALKPVEVDDARRALEQIRRWQRKLQDRLGRRLVYASDEMYLAAGEAIPSAKMYEGFPQLENGVGIVRRFLDQAVRAAAKLPERLAVSLRVTLITSALAAPFLSRFAARLNRTEGLEVMVEAVRNDFFGEMVTVTGLLTGRDIIGQLRGRPLGDALILPTVCLRDGLFLDDVSIEHLQEELGVPVHAISPHPAALVGKITELAGPPAGVLSKAV